MKRATQILGDNFRPVDKILQEKILPSFFLVADTTVPGQVITGLLVKQSGLEILHINHNSQGKCTSFCVVIGNLIADQWGCLEFRSRDHVQLLRDGRADIRRQKVLEAR